MDKDYVCVGGGGGGAILNVLVIREILSPFL